MTVIVNGTGIQLGDAATLAEAVATLGASDKSRGIAVAVNGEVVPRSQWHQTSLSDGDRIEVVTAVAGG